MPSGGGKLLPCNYKYVQLAQSSGMIVIPEQKVGQLHLGCLASGLPKTFPSQVFGNALLLVSRIQVSQKFKEAMDCFGDLPSLLVKSDMLNFRTCGIKEKTRNLEWFRAEIRTHLCHLLSVNIITRKVITMDYGMPSTCRHCTSQSAYPIPLVPESNPEAQTLSPFLSIRILKFRE